MKRYFPLYFLAALTLTGCELNETPYSGIYTENFYQTRQDAEAALIAAYAPLVDLYQGPAAVVASDFSADQTYPRVVVGRNLLTTYEYDVNYTTVKSLGRAYESPFAIWQYAYAGIERANWVIARVPATPMDAVRRSQIVAEAYFLRAFYHWTLAKNFNEIPVKTQPTASQEAAFTGKSTKAQVYQQIYADLDEALKSLPSYPTNDRGRASKEAALALYAKAALYNEEWPKALQRAEELISGGKVGLMANVRDLYDVTKEDEARRESLFAFEGERADPSKFTFMLPLTGPPNSAGIEYGNTSFGSIFAFQSFFDSFNPVDKRRGQLDTTYLNRQGQRVPQRSITPITPRGVLIKKYQDPNSIADRGNINIHILRYADVLLIAAEAEARANGPTAKAYGYLNQVRTRAGLSNLTPGLSKDAFIAALLQERSWEFFAEGDRWYDLTRTNTFMQVIPKATNDVFPVRNPQPRHRYFPIPLDEVLANPQLEQNPDWQ
jgi:hypothetical protein